MTMLDHYLKSVRLYLPGTTETADILAEIEEHLRSSMEEREEALGRPLTEEEQAALLTRHGNPAAVAARYGGATLGFAFGRQLISPEAFPLYARILLAQFVITFIVVITIQLTAEPMAASLVSRLLIPWAMQFVMTTVVFIGIDILRRRSGGTGSHPTLPWSFPPSHLQPVPRWQSASGMLVLGAVAVWWAAVPAFPWLALGSRAGVLTMRPVWSEIYWPILGLLVAGIVQRAVNFRRPDWNWLQPLVRTLTNGLAVALIPGILTSYPFVSVAAGVTDAGAVAAARAFNTAMWWHVLASFGLYWLISAAANLWMYLAYVRAVLRRRAWQTA